MGTPANRKREPKLELQKVLQADAADILAARERAKFIHGSLDVPAAGAEVEETVRRVLRRKLPNNYYVGHGHIIDSDWKCSPQLDVIIANKELAGAVFQAENGAEYFMYESVFAIGEIKASYLKRKKPIHKFSEILTRVSKELKREETPRGYTAHGWNISVGEGLELEFGDERPYRNPLFSFMIFAETNNFDLNDVGDLYAQVPDEELPNVVCFLDRGVILNGQAQISDQDGIKSVSAFDVTIEPQYNTYFNKKSYWGFFEFGEDNNRAGGSLAALHGILFTACNRCVLMTPDVTKYYNNIFKQNKADVFAKNEDESSNNISR